MIEVVIDASALVLLVAGKEAPARTLRRRIRSLERHAPHLVDAEVGNTLRRKVLVEELSPRTASAGLVALRTLVQHRYPHVGPLASAAWELRGAITFYDALYAALAATLAVPLLTADARLARAPGLSCQVELVA